MNVVENRPEALPLKVACDALGLNRSTVYARHRKTAESAVGTNLRSRKGCFQPNALSDPERRQVLDTLHSERFADQPPAQVHATLLDDGVYLCSVSTMHRLLREKGENGDRRNQRPAQHHAIPRLQATRPNEVWTWDITKLATVKPGVYLSLYVVMDLFSRFVLAWMVSRKENSALAQQLIREAMARYAVAAGSLTIHQDRGSPMIARSYLDMLSDLGATASHSRPRVSNDNPFSESQFKTLKYQPDYPGRFNHGAHATAWCAEYFDWYNFDHYHSGLARFTTAQVFTGEYRELAAKRQAALDEYYRQHKNRFVQGRPKVALPPSEVNINPVVQDSGNVDTSSGVNFPTLPYVKNSLTLQ
jgi:putative transposase